MNQEAAPAFVEESAKLIPENNSQPFPWQYIVLSTLGGVLLAALFFFFKKRKKPAIVIQEDEPAFVAGTRKGNPGGFFRQIVIELEMKKLAN